MCLHDMVIVLSRIVVVTKNMYKNNFTIDQIALASAKSTDETENILVINE